eukprot:jgi/Botrbrau1/14749/Bobra.0108s0092.1
MMVQSSAAIQNTLGVESEQSGRPKSEIAQNVSLPVKVPMKRGRPPLEESEKQWRAEAKAHRAAKRAALLHELSLLRERKRDRRKSRAPAVGVQACSPTCEISSTVVRAGNNHGLRTPVSETDFHIGRVDSFDDSLHAGLPEPAKDPLQSCSMLPVPSHQVMYKKVQIDLECCFGLGPVVYAQLFRCVQENHSGHLLEVIKYLAAADNWNVFRILFRKGAHPCQAGHNLTKS